MYYTKSVFQEYLIKKTKNQKPKKEKKTTKKRKKKKTFEMCQLYFIYLYYLILANNKQKTKKHQDLAHIHMGLPLLLYLIIVKMVFKWLYFHLFRVTLFSITAYDSNWYISALVFSYFNLILSIWETAKHNSKTVSHQIRSQDDKLYCMCEDSCSMFCISAKTQSHLHFEKLLYTSSYLGTNRPIVLPVITKSYKQN